MTDFDGWPNAVTREVAEGIRGDAVLLLDLLDRINGIQHGLTLDELHHAAGREVAAAWACRSDDAPPLPSGVAWTALGESFLHEVLRRGLELDP